MPPRSKLISSFCGVFPAIGRERMWMLRAVTATSIRTVRPWLRALSCRVALRLAAAPTAASTGLAASGVAMPLTMPPR